MIIIQLCCSYAQSHQSKIEATRITDQIYKIFLNDVDLIYVNIIAYLSDEGILLVDSGLEECASEVQEDDIIVHFQKSNILCVGDIIFTDSFSTIHIEKNGNLDKLVQVLKDLQTRYSPDTKVIVGHGEDITVADIAKYEKMTTETIAIVRKAMQKKLSAEQMKTGEILKDWRSWESPLFDELNCDLWIQSRD